MREYHPNTNPGEKRIKKKKEEEEEEKEAIL